MNRKNDIIYQIKNLYGDTSRSSEEAREQLEEIRDEIDMLLETLDD